MPDQPKEPSAPAGGSSTVPGQAQGGPPPLVIKAQYVKDLSFENPRAPTSLQGLQTPPSIQVSVKVSGQRLADADYEVMLTITAEAKTGDEALFLVELTYGGIVTLGNVAPEYVRPLLFIEAPRLLFPFARNVIAEATREGGFPPLLIQPVDFMELYRREIAQHQAAAPA